MRLIAIFTSVIAGVLTTTLINEQFFKLNIQFISKVIDFF